MYNSNLYNSFTFQMPPTFLPPPPAPPPFFLPPMPHISGISDQDFIKKFDNNECLKPKDTKPQTMSIHSLKNKLSNLVLTFKEISSKHNFLMENKTTLSEEQWKDVLAEIETKKLQMTNTLIEVNDSYLSSVKVLLTKRSAKRLRQKRIKLERKKEKEQRQREIEENSRKINEKLQSIKDEVKKTKLEHEAKLQADMVLKEVLRKKLDARKCISKLDALIKLRRARQNTARGRGEDISERDAVTFNNNIEKLKILWIEKLAIYEREESELRIQLSRGTEEQTRSDKKEREILDILEKWREHLFGDTTTTPQVDFGGNAGQFVTVRSQWDQYLSNDGSSLPIGWVTDT